MEKKIRLFEPVLTGKEIHYIKYIAKPLKEKFNALEYSKRNEFKNAVKEKTLQYI